jgi:phage gp46-like protein
MDFAIGNKAGLLEMSFDKSGDIRNNILVSLSIRKGSWWQDPEFGLRDRGRMKLTDQTVRLVRSDCLEALQWLKDTGRAKSIEVTTLRDRAENVNRIKVLVEAVQADGRAVTFEHFIEVV